MALLRIWIIALAAQALTLFRELGDELVQLRNDILLGDSGVLCRSIASFEILFSQQSLGALHRAANLGKRRRWRRLSLVATKIVETSGRRDCVIW